MAARSMAPGAALLRASRLFSVPPPLPKPIGELSTTVTAVSNTATLPHPIHMTITTPQSSQNQGDWGLKRSLPLRSTTKSSTPLIRVESMDTFEHITEYASAADHTLSLEKWHEMGIPITVPQNRKTNNRTITRGNGKSVFEDDIDSTHHTAPTTKGGADLQDVKWKFEGPWLAGMTDGEFSDYVSKEIRRRRIPFQKYLKAECAKEMTKKQRMDNAETGVEEATPEVQANDITDEQFREYVLDLRQDRTQLFLKIRAFLDMPPSPAPQIDVESLLFLSKDGPTSASPYAETGPPSTHPSAGLYYSRSNAKLFNHPKFGPQKFQPPVEARVIKPQSALGSSGSLLGVGGFVTDIPAGDYGFKVKAANVPAGIIQEPLTGGIANIEPDKFGGSKTYIQPQSATIDTKGRVVLKVSSAEEQAVYVKLGKTDQLKIPEPVKKISPGGATKFLNFGDSGAGKRPSTNPSGYGL
ncbi:mitochondrial ribosomal protein MRP51 [Halenospora varia]|nr:mitochondrial ribosomal protein MRP51 [Halenospora varia]